LTAVAVAGCLGLCVAGTLARRAAYARRLACRRAVLVRHYPASAARMHWRRGLGLERSRRLARTFIGSRLNPASAAARPPSFFARHLARAESALEASDIPALVGAWLALAEEGVPLKEQRAMGYRPHDRLSGFEELWPESGRRTALVVRALREAQADRPWAAWGMAQRWRLGRLGEEAKGEGDGIASVGRPDPSRALACARQAAEGGVLAAQAGLGGWLLEASGAQPDAEAEAAARAEGVRWCRAAAERGHRGAAFRLAELEAGRHWSAVATAGGGRGGQPGLALEWGVARYQEAGWEGRGVMGLESPPTSTAQLQSLATEHGLPLLGNNGPGHEIGIVGSPS
jgi:hypothetical protein